MTIPKKAIEVPCRCGCGTTARITGARRTRYEEGGTLPFASMECRDRGKRTEVNCARPACGNSVSVSKKYLEQRKKGVFCSRECMIEEGCKPKTGESVPCEQCGSHVWVKPSERKEKNFCSPPCHSAWQARNQVAKKCEICKTDFSLPPSRETYQAGRFCSRACMGRAKSAASSGWRTSNGYWRIPDPDNPGQSIDEHVYKARIALGRNLRKGEEVHHRNGNRIDNRTNGPFVLNERGHLVSGNLEIWSIKQPRGQEIGPKLDWALEMLEEYGEFLSEEHRGRLAAILDRGAA